MTKVEGKSRKANANRGAKPGERRGGRQKGTPNKTTGALKDAILAAANNVGIDGSGKGGVEGYLTNLAIGEPRAFATLLGKVLPMQVQGDPDAPFTIKIVKGLGE